MSKGRNVTFNAVMDEELLDGMYEQVLLGRKADRGFKGEAYEAVAVAMTANSNGEYVITKQSIVNRCKYQKENYSIATELLNTSGFGYDNTTKCIIAANDVWTTWIEGHPDAKPYQAKVLDARIHGSILVICGLPRTTSWNISKLGRMQGASA